MPCKVAAAEWKVTELSNRRVRNRSHDGVGGRERLLSLRPYPSQRIKPNSDISNENDR